jgi:hypothetical protein
MEHQALVLPAFRELQQHARRRADGAPRLAVLERRALAVLVALPLAFVQLL